VPAAATSDSPSIDVQYWIPFLGYLVAIRHNPLSLNFPENTVVYFALGFIVRNFTAQVLVPISIFVFAGAAVVEWSLFSRLKPRMMGWDKLDRQSFIWGAWQAFCFFSLGLLL
jgi:hypothetical protein